MSEPFVPKIVLFDAHDLIPYEANAKKHSADDNEKLALAIRTYGHDQPIVAWTPEQPDIIKGHGRRAAVLINHEKHGLTKMVPVIFRPDLTKEQADAARLADNQVISKDYDTELLQQELRRLTEIGEDLSAAGFSDKELEFLTEDLGAMDEDLFVEDIGEAVETQKAENVTKAAEVDSASAPVGDALGFKRVTVEQSRGLRAWMAKIEAATGKTGAEAILAHARTLK
jgi:ParB-like chromosome segregation protein Spo0J